MADRYTYVPYVGLAIAVAWAVPAGLRPRLRKLLGIVAVAWLLALSVATWHQVRLWEDERVLFEHALRVTHDHVPTEASSRQGVMPCSRIHASRRAAHACPAAPSRA